AAAVARAAAAVDAAVPAPGGGPVEIAQVLRHVAPPAGEVVGRVGVGARVVADRQHALEAPEGPLAERRLELGLDEEWPPRVHDLDRLLVVVVAVAVQVAAVGSAGAPLAERAHRGAQLAARVADRAAQ